MHRLTRRGFLRIGTTTALGLGASRVLAGCGGDGGGALPPGAAAALQGSSAVHVVLGDTLGELHGMAVRAAEALGITGNALTGATVFIKPNFMRLGVPLPFDATSGDVTKPEITLGVAEACLRAGAARVTIGEGGQSVSWRWNEVNFLPGSTVHGALDLLAAVAHPNATYGDRLELANLNVENLWDPIPSSSGDELMIGGLRVARRVLEADHVISVPTLKSHQWTGITASMKSLFGTTPLTDGYSLIGEPGRYGVHMAYVYAVCGGVPDAGVEASYIDILRWRKDRGRQDFGIIDCSIGIEGNGPAGGGVPENPVPGFGGTTVDVKARSPIGKYFLLASDDLVAADATAARVTGHDASAMRQLIIGRAVGLGNPDRVRLQGASLDELLMPDWKKAEYMPEWGTASIARVHALRGPAGDRPARIANHLSSLICPLGMIGVLRWLGRRKASVAQMERVEELAEKALRHRQGLAASPGPARTGRFEG